jgi:hypothetical protein
VKTSMWGPGSALGDRLFYFLTFFRKIFTSRFILERFQKVDPELSAVDHDAELTCLGARGLGPENNISYPTLKFFCEEICMFS